jgi:hypothetical protein
LKQHPAIEKKLGFPARAYRVADKSPPVNALIMTRIRAVIDYTKGKHPTGPAIRKTSEDSQMVRRSVEAQ